MAVTIEDSESKKLETLKNFYFQYELTIIFLLATPAYIFILSSLIYLVNVTFPDGDKNLSHSIAQASEASFEYHLLPITLFLAVLALSLNIYSKIVKTRQLADLNKIMAREDKKNIFPLPSKNK
jgi:hypothetical protein